MHLFPVVVVVVFKQKRKLLVSNFVSKRWSSNSLLILSKSKLINFYFHRNYQKYLGFLIILGGIEVY